jgi:hypothetical protein
MRHILDGHPRESIMNISGCPYRFIAHVIGLLQLPINITYDSCNVLPCLIRLFYSSLFSSSPFYSSLYIYIYIIAIVQIDFKPKMKINLYYIHYEIPTKLFRAFSRKKILRGIIIEILLMRSF